MACRRGPQEVLHRERRVLEESGFEYCTRPYLLGQEFTADTYYQEFALMDWMKEPERAELRRRIDAGFAAYGE